MTAHITKSIAINAPTKNVVYVLTNEQMSAIWNGVSMPGSYMEGEWKQGGVVRYLDGQGYGLQGIVTHFEPEKCLRIDYEVSIENGEARKDSEETKKWQGSYDEWNLTEQDGVTTLTLESESPQEYYDTFMNMWDLALTKIKELAEGM